MSNYSKSQSFTALRGTTPADPAVLDTEFALVATASATKMDKTGGTFSGAIVVPAAAATGETTKAIQAQDVKHYAFTAGVKIPAYMSAAPTGWTQDTSLNDYMLTVVSGAGGSTAGTNGASLGVPATATGSHVLTTTEMPAHTHNYSHDVAGSSGVTGSTGSALSGTLTASSSAGGGGGHTHTLTSWVPLIAKMILITKD